MKDLDEVAVQIFFRLVVPFSIGVVVGINMGPTLASFITMAVLATVYGLIIGFLTAKGYL